MPAGMPKVLGTGFIALDLVVSSDPESPIQSWAGGTCGNVLSILAWLGWEAYPISRLNGDAASIRIRSDLQRWGVHLDLVDCVPTVNAPIIVQEIRQLANGDSTHRFSWTCLRCGGWLPSFRPVTRAVVDRVAPYIPGTSVFFFDRVSRGALDVAAQAARSGAVVMFEPSGRGDKGLFREALDLAHIVKYADQRIANLSEGTKSANLRLEIQTLGSAGLRFRLPRDRRDSEWRALGPTPIGSVVDACGSGDWCTAGVLSKLATEGISSLEESGVSGIASALMYGQKLAAWNCAFEGARGGMYAKEQSGAATYGWLAGVRERSDISVDTAVPTLVGCPSCDAA
jgi:sugar/nucleoside kinase (ribokinase family)